MRSRRGRSCEGGVGWRGEGCTRSDKLEVLWRVGCCRVRLWEYIWGAGLWNMILVACKI